MSKIFLLAGLLLVAWPLQAAEVKRPVVAPVSLGKLEAFWRYSAVLGPVLERGYGLIEIPSYVLDGDFPYRKRPYREEVPFADHLSVVRLLGGYHEADDSGKGEHPRDIAYRESDGKIHYRMELLHQRLDPYRQQGYTNLTLVLDNIPWCFPQKPTTAKYGQCAPPTDPQEWHDFIKALCQELVKMFGEPTARQLRFRIGTENHSRKRFDGTHEDYVRHYDASAAAIQEVLPTAKVGAYNVGGVSMRSVDGDNVSIFKLAKHCVSEKNSFNGMSRTPFDWLAYSRYFSPEDDPQRHAHICGEVWRSLEQRYPSLKGTSREIHEFGMAPFGEESKGAFISAEHGALGAAFTCQMMFRLREAGINRLWHWKMYDGLRGRDRKLQYLFTGQAWLLNVLEHLVGNDTWLLPVSSDTTSTRQPLVAGCFSATNSCFVVSDITNSAQQPRQVVTFTCPQSLRRHRGQTCRLVRMNRQTSPFDRVRADLAAAKLLEPKFVSRPERLGSLEQMTLGKPGDALVVENWRRYTSLWTQSLTLRPFTPADGQIESRGDTLTVRVNVAPPEVVVLRFD